MIFERRALFLVTLAGIVSAQAVFASENAAEPSAAETQEAKEYRQDVERVKSLGEAKKLDELQKAADEIEKKWRTRTVQRYADVVLKVCQTLASQPLGDDKQYAMSSRFAATAMRHLEQREIGEAATISHDTEYWLLLHLQVAAEPEGKVRGKDWEQKRTEQARWWLRAWQRLDEQIDKNWDHDNLPPEDRFTGNVFPPPGVPHAAAGMSPEDIEDPKLRKEYEEAIEKNTRNAEKFVKQTRLREEKKRLTPKAEKYIIKAYSTAPYNAAEMQGYLDKYVEDQEATARILAAVKKKISDNEQQEPQ